jgi:hypothetical protein
MENSKSNPKRWYLAMYLCIILSFFVFIAGPRIGYGVETSHALALMIGLWAPTIAVFGLRAELLDKLQKKD